MLRVSWLRSCAVSFLGLPRSIAPALSSLRTASATLALGWLLVFSIGSAAHAADHREANIRHALESITAEELQQHVNVLADDTFEGREAGSRGGRAAAVYLHKYLTAKKLRPAGTSGSFFQEFDGGKRNVLAVIEGSDPELKNQYVVIGAHYDHVGYGTRRNSYGPTGFIHNGADDNASGVAGVLELVEAFQQLAEPPRRSILIAFWDGEEKGLQGSKHWIRNPTVDLNRIAFATNLDMIGRLRNNTCEVFACRSTFGMRRLLAGVNQDDPIKLKFVWDIKANSDHHTFFSYGIPIVMFHTGLHNDYHRPRDDAHKINAEGMRRVTGLLFRTVLTVANRDTNMKFRADSRRESDRTRKVLEAPAGTLAPRLGIDWKRNEDGSLTITEVVPRTAGDQAGLRRGMRILKIDGAAIPANDQAIQLHILAAPKSLKLTLAAKDNEEGIDRTVALSGSPSRIGISWRNDPEDNSNVVVTLMRSGSAAQHAGVKLGDRILAINGKRFDGSNDLLQKLKKLPSPIELTLEKRGILRTVVLKPLPPLER